MENNHNLMNNGASFSMFNDKTALIIILSFSTLMVFYILLNSFLRKFKKDKYHGTRFTTKNIAYITMLTSVSVVATIIVSVTIPITVLPPVRIAIEGLMIKISGYMFGPIIGIICATITDLIVMLFVPSYINPVYIFCVVLTGFLAGIAGVVKNKLQNHHWVVFLLINFFVVLFAVGGAYLATLVPQQNIKINDYLAINKYIFAGMILLGGFLTLLVIYSVLFYYWKNNKIQRIQELLPIILLAVVSEYVVTVLIAAYADMSLLTPGHAKDYTLTVIVRLSMAPFKIIINSIIIYITWKTVSPLINIDNLN